MNINVLADNPRKLRWTIINRFIVADTNTLKYLNRFVLSHMNYVCMMSPKYD